MDDHGGSLRRWSAMAALLAVSLAALSAYLPILAHDLVWDDPILVDYTHRVAADRGYLALLKARFLVGEENQPGVPYYRPLPFISIFLDSLFAPVFPAVYHLNNLLLYVAICLLAHLLLRLLLPSRASACAAALLFALYPLHAESVAPVSGRADLWMVFFVLSSALAFVRVEKGLSPRPAVERAGGLLFFLFACLSKEAAVMLPPVLALGSWLLRPRGMEARSWWERNRLWAAGWALVLAANLLLRVAVMDGAGGIPSPGWVVLQGGWWDAPRRVSLLLLTYARLLVVPFPHNIFYTESALAPGPVTAAGVLLLAALFLAAFHPRRRRLGAATAVWIAGFLLPAVLFLPTVAVAGERFLFVSSLGAAFAAGWAVERLRLRGGWRAGAAWTGVALAAGLSFADVRAQLAYWKDPVSLFTALTRDAPGLAAGWNNLGNAYARRGRRQEALDAYGRSLDISPSMGYSHYGRGIVLLETGKPREAADAFARAASWGTRVPRAWTWRGNALETAGLPAEAEASYRRALAADPSHFAARTNLAILLIRSGRREEAREEARRLAEIDPAAAEGLQGLLGDFPRGRSP